MISYSICQVSTLFSRRLRCPTDRLSCTPKGTMHVWALSPPLPSDAFIFYFAITLMHSTGVRADIAIANFASTRYIRFFSMLSLLRSNFFSFLDFISSSFGGRKEEGNRPLEKVKVEMSDLKCVLTNPLASLLSGESKGWNVNEQIPISSIGRFSSTILQQSPASNLSQS